MVTPSLESEAFDLNRMAFLERALNIATFTRMKRGFLSFKKKAMRLKENS